MMRQTLNNPVFSLVRRATALLSLISLLTISLPVDAQQPKTRTTQRLSENQRVLHVLNRLGFGPRPGDLERVKKMGLGRYIDEQLHPEKINDQLAEARLSNLPSLTLSTPELYARYPNPGMLVRQLQMRGELPADLAALKNDVAGKADVKEAAKSVVKENKKGDAQEPIKSDGTGAASTSSVTESAQASQDQSAKRDYRQAIREYYLANNLQQPQRITAELQASRILRAVYSERQLQEVMVDFWTNHFNVFAGKGADRWLLVSYDRDTIRPNALGNFSDLLIATAQSPAMLFYLDNFQSVSPNTARPNAGAAAMRDLRPFRRMMEQRRQLPGLNADVDRLSRPAPISPSAQMPPVPQAKRPKRGINENYARELMELHTLGVDGGYTQKDVQEVARCFTGWTIMQPRGGLNYGGEINPDAGKFTFNPRLHDDGEKLVLGHKIPAGGGMKDGLMVLDILAHHPSTARFIATKLSRRFVMDNPPPALVERVAAAFTRSNGDIKETLRAVFTSPEFNSVEAYRAKIKTPFELAVSAMRAVGAETNGNPPIHQWIAKMGEPLYQYQAPTGYPDTAETWVNTGALLERLNFALALASNRIPGTRVDLKRLVGDDAVDQTRLAEQFIKTILQDDISPQTRATLMKQLNGAATENAANMNQRASIETTRSSGYTDAAKIAGLVLGAPEFQRQ